MNNASKINSKRQLFPCERMLSGVFQNLSCLVWECCWWEWRGFGANMCCTASKPYSEPVVPWCILQFRLTTKWTTNRCPPPRAHRELAIFTSLKKKEIAWFFCGYPGQILNSSTKGTLQTNRCFLSHYCMCHLLTIFWLKKIGIHLSDNTFFISTTSIYKDREP